MGILGRAIFREILSSAFLGTALFTFVLFLQRAGRSFELLVRSSATPGTVAYLFALILPFTLTFALPVGALVGILIALSRMSGDGEIIGMRAMGMPSRRVVAPVLMIAALFMAVTAACSLWLTPWSIRQTYRMLNRLAAEELTAEVQPRVFEEQFPNAILYVGDVIPGQVERWRNVFLADSRPGEQAGAQEDRQGPLVTIAREAIAVPDVRNNRIQLHLIDASTHQATKDPNIYVSTSFPAGDQVLQASRAGEVRPTRSFSEMDTVPLLGEARRSREAAIELHQRLALPFACLLLALVGVPLGVSSRRAGKSSAFVVTVFLAFVYYMGLISLISLARQGALPVAPAVWAPNVVFAIAGLALLLRLERPGDRDLVDQVRARFQGLWGRLRGRLEQAPVAGAVPGRLGRFHLLPQILDTYILSTFLFYFALLLASFVLLTHVYTFFELLGDIVRNKIPMSRVLAYLVFLTPKLIYDSAPVSVLVAVLVTFGVMAKHNEVTAFKATGVSLHRLALPVLMASLVVAAGLFAFDYSSILPEANRRQDALRDEIKGRAPQTYLRPDRKWIYGQGPRIYYYRYFDPAAAVMVGVNVYEFDTRSFRLKRHISAERAHWDAALSTWIFESGWSREMRSRVESTGQVFRAATFPELDEPPGYFLKEVIQDKQMNFAQLAAYIQELRQSGFDTVNLRIQLQKKFSVPLLAFIMALISVPFAFMTGSRGAMAGVGVSLGIAVAYWALGQLFEQIGSVNQLPASLAAWSPDAIFSLAGVYLMTRMRT